MTDIENNPTKQQSPTDIIQDNQYAIIYQNDKSIRLMQIRAGDKFQTSDGGAFRHFNIVKKHWNSDIQAFNKPDKTISVLKPKSTLITETLARKTQILYSMDNAAILFKLNIVAGSVVVEAGTGSGSLSCAISQAIGKNGQLFTFQFNKERAQITKEFFVNMEKHNITSTWRDVVSDGFLIEGTPITADCLFLDVPNPWDALHHTKAVLKKFGRICCFSPCIEQVQKTCDGLRKHKFVNIETQQCLIREIQINNNEIQLQGISENKRVSGLSRATHNNRGHTGYLTFAVSL